MKQEQLLSCGSEVMVGGSESTSILCLATVFPIKICLLMVTVQEKSKKARLEKGDSFVLDRLFPYDKALGTKEGEFSTVAEVIRTITMLKHC